MKFLFMLLASSTALATSKVENNNVKGVVDTTADEVDDKRRRLDDELAVSIPEGEVIECANEGTGDIYHWADGSLHHYPNGLIAASWDMDWRSKIVRIDCSNLMVGYPMMLKKIPEGMGVRCTDTNDGKVYRWMNGQLNQYLNGRIASSWDRGWRNNIYDLNCELFEIGDDVKWNFSDIVPGSRKNKIVTLESIDNDDEIYEDIPDISDEDVKRVMEWIKAETTMVKNPFCWKTTYGRGVGTLPGRVADCPAGYTNNGLTCGRGTDDIFAPSKVASCPNGYTNMGLTCYRGPHDIFSPSKVANCPNGYTNMGLTCTKWSSFPPKTVGWGSFTCDAGYSKSDITQRCIKNCESGYTNTGEFCHRDAITKGWGSFTCDAGYFKSDITHRCHKNCPNEYTSMGETCHRPMSILGLDSMGCKSDEKEGGVAGERCYPINGSKCFNNGDFDAGFCYSKCESGHDGVGPVCWQTCDNSMVSCGMSCGKTTADCVIAGVDQAVSTLVLAANIATLGLGTPATGAVTAGVTATMTISGKAVAGTTKLGKALIKAAQSIKPNNLKPGANVIQRIVTAKFGTQVRTIKTIAKVGSTTYQAMQDYRTLYAEDFAAQTSDEIVAELDSHFHPITAKFLKGLWGERMMEELAEANNWEIAGYALAAASIVDISGVTGVVSAYAKPICKTVVPFPCTDAGTDDC